MDVDSESNSEPDEMETQKSEKREVGTLFIYLLLLFRNSLITDAVLFQFLKI